MEDNATAVQGQNMPDPLGTLTRELVNGSHKPSKAFKTLMEKWRSGELGVEPPPPGDRSPQEQPAACSTNRPKAARTQEPASVAHRHRPRKAPEKDATLAMVVAYSNGATLTEVAAAHCVSEQAVRDALQGAGLQLRGERKPALSVKMRAEAQTRHAAGQSAREIGRRFGVSHTTIGRFIRSLEVPVPDMGSEGARPSTIITDIRGPVASASTRANSPLDATAVERLVQNYKSGATVAELATQHGVHRATVRAKLRTSNVVPRERAPQHDHAEQFIQLYNERYSIAAIGKRYGLTPSKVRTQLIRLGANLQG